MRISDWSSDVCSSDLPPILLDLNAVGDKIIARVLLSVLNLLPQIVDHSASTLDDLLQIMFVEQLMLPGHELPGSFLRPSHQFQEHLDRAFEREVRHELACAIDAHRKSGV